MFVVQWAKNRTSATTEFDSYTDAEDFACRNYPGKVHCCFDGKVFELWAGSRLQVPGEKAVGIPKISASSISAFAGRHPYRDPKMVIPQVVRGYLPDIMQLVGDDAAPSMKEVAAKIGANPGVQKAIAESAHQVTDVALPKSAAKQSASSIKSAASAVDLPDAPPSVVKSAIDYVSSALQRNRGTALESGTLDRLRQEGHDVKAGQTSFQRVFKAGDHYTAVIGQVDGIIDRDGVPVVCEIKNRQNGFRAHSRCSYDIDQLACYVFLSGFTAGVLVEQYNGELKLSWFTREELAPRWGQILSSCGEAITRLYSLREKYDPDVARELGLVA